MNRDELQLDATILASSNNRLLLKWATGVGKSLAFMLIQEMLKPNLTYIVVSEKPHINNWKEDYKKHKKEHLLKNVKIFCYASLKKYSNTKVDLICLDEAHHATSDIRINILKSIEATTIIGLSATLRSEQLKVLNELGEFFEHKINLNKAIKDNILPTPIINLIPLDFPKGLTSINFTRGNSQKRITKKCIYKDRFKYISDKKNYIDLNLEISCTYKEKNDYLTGLVEFYKKRYFITKNQIWKNKWLLLGSERKRFLANLKTEIVKNLINKIKDKRYICFTGSIEQANYLSKNVNVIHSQVKDSDSIINSFNNGNINHLYVVDMLREGQNLNNVEVGIIVQLDGEIGRFIQKSGRIMRAKNPEIFVLYFKNSRDEGYLENLKNEINKDYIRVINLENLKNE